MPTLTIASEEVCDNADNDCDLEIDEGVMLTWYSDDDGDGYGNAAGFQSACGQPSGYVTDATDCDDASSAVNSAATETCDGVDNNCDGTTDTATVYYNADGDGITDDLDDDDDGDDIEDSLSDGSNESEESDENQADSSGGCGCDLTVKNTSSSIVLQLMLLMGVICPIIFVRTRKKT